MPTHTQPPKPQVFPQPKYPEVEPPMVEPVVPVVPDDSPEVIPTEDPFDNPPPFEVPEPGEGP